MPSPATTLPPAPDAEHGLANLMASLSLALGGSLPPTLPLAGLAEVLAGRKTIILLVADGVGEAQLRQHLPDGLLARQRLQTLESVFPSTTASAVGTLLTGLAPISHGLTGWHVWAEEVGELLAILPLSRRQGLSPLPQEREAWASRILAAPDLPTPLALAPRLQARVTHIAPSAILYSPFNRQLTQGATKLGYEQLPGLFRQLRAALESPEQARPHFIYAYWPDFDSLAHQYGPDSPEAGAALTDFQQGLESFIGAGLNQAALLLTADHGFISAPPERLLCLNDYPDLQRLLRQPLSGERRAAYAHIHPGQVETFTRLAEQHLGHALWIAPSQELLAGGWFGRGPQHPRLASRIGDLTLLLKDDWTLKDCLPGEREHMMLGMHGGVSPAERQVPLCLFL